jgi:hypothetical protein
MSFDFDEFDDLVDARLKLIRSIGALSQSKSFKFLSAILLILQVKSPWEFPLTVSLPLVKKLLKLPKSLSKNYALKVFRCG